jgi:hypothetical protein
MRKGRKGIELQSIEPVPHDDLRTKSVVFEYEGLPTEVNDFVRLAQRVGLNMEAQSEEQLGERISHFKMSFSRDQFDRFMTVLHEWKINR